MASQARITRSIARLIQLEFPRLCRGGSRSLTFAGVVPGLSIDETPLREPPKHTNMEFHRWTSCESLNHSKWECKYHVVFIPKCRRKTLYVQLRQYLGEVFRKLAEQKESRIEEGHLMPDHVHMMISIPPKYAVSQVIGFIKGKSAIHLARVYGEKRRNFVGQSFWARGYFVSTVGRRRRGDPELHPQPGAGGPTPGADEPLAVTATSVAT